MRYVYEVGDGLLFSAATAKPALVPIGDGDSGQGPGPGPGPDALGGGGGAGPGPSRSEGADDLGGGGGGGGDGADPPASGDGGKVVIVTPNREDPERKDAQRAVVEFLAYFFKRDTYYSVEVDGHLFFFICLTLCRAGSFDK